MYFYYYHLGAAGYNYAARLRIVRRIIYPYGFHSFHKRISFLATSRFSWQTLRNIST